MKTISLKNFLAATLLLGSLSTFASTIEHDSCRIWVHSTQDPHVEVLNRSMRKILVDKGYHPIAFKERFQKYRDRIISLIPTHPNETIDRQHFISPQVGDLVLDISSGGSFDSYINKRDLKTLTSYDHKKSYILAQDINGYPSIHGKDFKVPGRMFNEQIHPATKKMGSAKGRKSLKAIYKQLPECIANTEEDSDLYKKLYIEDKIIELASIVLNQNPHKAFNNSLITLGGTWIMAGGFLVPPLFPLGVGILVGNQVKGIVKDDNLKSRKNSLVFLHGVHLCIEFLDTDQEYECEAIKSYIMSDLSRRGRDTLYLMLQDRTFADFTRLTMDNLNELNPKRFKKFIRRFETSL